MKDLIIGESPIKLKFSKSEGNINIMVELYDTKLIAEIIINCGQAKQLQSFLEKYNEK